VKGGSQKLIPELLGERLEPSLGLSILGVHRVEVLEIDELREVAGLDIILAS
jgi:hypothetical protein